MEPSYEEIRERFLVLASLDSKQREQELRNIQSESPELVTALKELFAHDESADEKGFLDYDSFDEGFLTKAYNETYHSKNNFPSQIDGYEIEKVIGEGGMGLVLKGLDTETKRIAALKLMSIPSVVSSEVTTRFSSEIEAIARLEHPHIIPIYSAGDYQGTPYYAMKYIEGDSLENFLHNQQLSQRESAEILRKLAGAVAFAHDHNVIHRDLKPANVLLDSNGIPLLADFGVAKLTDAEDELTKTGGFVGTPQYMAPEQFGELHLTSPSTDVYGLGAILYKCLTNKPPFEGSLTQLFKRVREQDPIPPSQIASVDSELEAICLKCLAKVPGDRYLTVRALSDDLNRYLHEEPLLEATQESTIGFLSRMVSRQPTLDEARALPSVLWIGLITCLFHGTVFALIANEADLLWIWTTFAMGMSGLTIVNLYYYWFPYWQLNQSERQAGVINFSVNVALIILILLKGPLSRSESITNFWEFYPSAALIVGVAAFTYGSFSTGRFFMIGLIWFALAVGCEAFPFWSPLLFALIGAVTIVGAYREIRQTLNLNNPSD
jgi:serine/threonine protein kinase